MEKKISYSEAALNLELLLEQLESGDIELELLPAKIKEAKEWIAICEAILRDTDQAIEDIIT